MPIAALSAITVINYAVLTAESNLQRKAFCGPCVRKSLFAVLSVPQTDRTCCFSSNHSWIFPRGAFSSAIVKKYFRMPRQEIFTKGKVEFFDLLKQWPILAASSFLASGCLIIDQMMAVLVGEGAVAMVSFGNRVSLGMIGLASVLWTVLFPQFIKKVVTKRFIELQRSFLTVQVAVFVIGGMLSAFIALESEWIARVLYERGEFTSEDTKLVAMLQAVYFLHIPFYVSILVSMRILNAFEKSWFYLFCNAALLTCNAILNFVFIEAFGLIGIATATLCSYAVMAVIWLIVSCQIISRAPHVPLNQ